jgi:polyhydroxyalkanoate synthesis repressor PhaR
LKYPNRRLYDTSTHRYITLEDVRQIALNHCDFVVRDRRTGADITCLTLLNVLVNDADDSRTWELFNRQFLLDAIRTHVRQEPESHLQTGAQPERVDEQLVTQLAH